ncbi:MAG: ATP-binding protein [bacterium]
MRYLYEYLIRDLRKKMILLSGPRQTGKTFLSKFLAEKNGVYLNWDIRSDQKIIREIGWPKNVSLVVLDELHKYPQWKNFLKGIVDEFENKPPMLVTGSAKLDAYRHAGDALTGRYYSFRLHPIDVAEAKLFVKNYSPVQCLERLIKTGGFPESFLNVKEAERLRNGRFDLVVQEDLRDLSKSNSIRGIKILIEILRERVGSQLNYFNLSKDIGVSPHTIKSWIELLERLFIIFIVPPFSAGLARSLRKEPKFYFYDCAAAYSDDQGPVLENIVACSLIKFCNLQRDAYGKNMELRYYRDREKREVDFVIILNRKAYLSIEVKKRDDSISPHLLYLHSRIKPRRSVQLVKELTRPKEIRGIQVVSLSNWLDNLYRDF